MWNIRFAPLSQRHSYHLMLKQKVCSIYIGYIQWINERTHTQAIPKSKTSAMNYNQKEDAWWKNFSSSVFNFHFWLTVWLVCSNWCLFFLSCYSCQMVCLLDYRLSDLKYRWGTVQRMGNFAIHFSRRLYICLPRHGFDGSFERWWLTFV